MGQNQKPEAANTAKQFKVKGPWGSFQDETPEET